MGLAVELRADALLDEEQLGSALSVPVVASERLVEDAFGVGELVCRELRMLIDGRLGGDRRAGLQVNDDDLARR